MSLEGVDHDASRGLDGKFSGSPKIILGQTRPVTETHIRGLNNQYKIKKMKKMYQVHKK